MVAISALLNTTGTQHTFFQKKENHGFTVTIAIPRKKR